MAKRSKRRRRTTSEKVMLVLGVRIALSMIFALIVGLGSRGSGGQAPLPENWTDFDSDWEGDVDFSSGSQSEAEVDMELPDRPD